MTHLEGVGLDPATEPVMAPEDPRWPPSRNGPNATRANGARTSPPQLIRFLDRIALRLDETSQVDMALGEGARERGAESHLIDPRPVRVRLRMTGDLAPLFGCGPRTCSCPRPVTTADQSE
ncbi:hypothetical protein GCM10007079_07070 [Nocardiopsis terrae]|nr:hypothetical protein GCM10007079_07070 [Nocardiopsis terrae]